MDSNAIKEIANQLGVGADYLLNHLSEFAPKWAVMQVAKSGVACVFLAVALVLSWRLFMSSLHDPNDDDGLACSAAFWRLVCSSPLRSTQLTWRRISRLPRRPC